MEGLFTRDIKEQNTQTYQQTSGLKEFIDSEQHQEVEDDNNLDRQQQQTNKGRGLAVSVAKKIAKNKIARNRKKST